VAYTVEASLQHGPETTKVHCPFGTANGSIGEILMARIIEMIVSPKGETTIQTKGYSGSECLQASQWLEQALGVAIEEHKTAEFYQAVSAEQHLQQ
jgi:hypothetical protein